MHAFMFDVLKRLAYDAPYFVVLGVGIWICTRNRVRNPEASRRFILAFALFGGTTILHLFNDAWLTMRAAQVTPAVALLMRYGVTSLVLSLLNYAAWVILLMGIHQAFRSESTAA